MGVVTFTEEFSSPVPAKRMFATLILDADTLIPKVMPQAIKSIETTNGDGGPGTIKTLTFAEGAPMKHLKHRVDALDKEKMAYSYTVIEAEGGGEFSEKVESVSYEIKYEATPDGGMKGTSIQKYSPKPGKEIKEEEIKEANAKAEAFFKAVEGYLLANPDVYA